ncbi:MAG: hypothetical protein EAZ57_00640 [Cytophagales bacterium]|nr:MAG: hypothetical protein EAZ67_00490 [Cytophagales bacterium]TAF62294.1 MAG: hypothetical protein EAZ57_00640 [Cytophagales bacterium]
MKKHFSLFLAILAFVAFSVSSCKKSEPTVADKMEGIWTVDKFDFKIKVAGQDFPLEDTTGQTPTEKPLMEFKADKKLFITTKDDEGKPVIQEGTWELLENDTKMKMSGLIDPEDFGGGEFEIEPQTIADLQTFKITELTGNSLKMNSIGTTKIKVDPFPFPVDVEINLLMELKK